MADESSDFTGQELAIQETGDDWSLIFSQKLETTDFICPLSGQPMIDPVLAEDGFNYERRAITKYFQDCEKSGETISPMLREPMGTKLEPADQLKAAIEKVATQYQAQKKLLGGEASDSPLVCLQSSTSDLVEWTPHGLQPKDVMRANQANAQSSQMQSEMYADMNKRMSEVFRVLDPLRDLLQEVLDGWTPPKIVVIGDESAGKSTILEQLAMMPIFPRQKRFCTRSAIHVRLRRNPNLQGLATLAVMDRATKQIESGPAPIPIEHGFEHVQKEMNRLLIEHGCEAGVIVSKIIVLEVQHPCVPSIDLVDLPGVTTVRKKGRADDVRTIINTQLEEDRACGDHAMYLVIVPASDRPNCSASMGFIEENQLQARAFGVFTHCDERGKVTTAELRSLMLGEDIMDSKGGVEMTADDLGYVPLEKGWIGTMLATPEDKDGNYENGYYNVHNFERLYRQKQAEIEFFSGKDADPVLQQLFSDGKLCVGALSDQLVKEYTECLNSTWKVDAMTKVLWKLEEKEFERNMLGNFEQTELADRAAREAERRLLSSSDALYEWYMHEVVHGKVKNELFAVLEPFRSQLCDENIMEYLASLKAAVDKAVHTHLLEGDTGLVQHWSKELKELFMAEVKVEAVQQEGKERTFKVVMHFFERVSQIILHPMKKRDLHKAVKEQQLFRLEQYVEYADAVMSACSAKYQEAAAKIAEKISKASSRLVCFDSKWLTFTPNESISVMRVKCDIEGFVQSVMAFLLSQIPSPRRLTKLLNLKEFPIGAETREMQQQRTALDDLILKIEVARDGIRKALDITDDEFEGMLLNMK